MTGFLVQINQSLVAELQLILSNFLRNERKLDWIARQSICISCSNIQQWTNYPKCDAFSVLPGIRSSPMRHPLVVSKMKMWQKVRVLVTVETFSVSQDSLTKMPSVSAWHLILGNKHLRSSSTILRGWVPSWEVTKYSGKKTSWEAEMTSDEFPHFHVDRGISHLNSIHAVETEKKKRVEQEKQFRLVKELNHLNKSSVSRAYSSNSPPQNGRDIVFRYKCLRWYGCKHEASKVQRPSCFFLSRVGRYSRPFRQVSFTHLMRSIWMFFCHFYSPTFPQFDLHWNKIVWKLYWWSSQGHSWHGNGLAKLSDAWGRQHHPNKHAFLQQNDDPGWI